MSDVVDKIYPEERANMIRGYKAALSNDQVSEEAKENARKNLEILEEGKTDFTSVSVNKEENDDKDPTRVAAGLKAAIANPSVSEESKKSAQEKLDKMENA